MANPAAILRAKVLQDHPEAVVHGRGKTWIRHQLANHPDGRKRFALDSGVGVLHYGDQFDQEINTDWVADTGAWQWKMEQADYQAHARNVFNAGNILEYRDRVTGQWVIFDPQSINWINQDNSRQQIAIKQAVNAEVSGDVMNFPAAYGAGRHFRYKLEPGQLQKLITIDSAANLPAPTVTGTVWFEAEFSLSHSAGIGLWLDGVKWAKVNNVRVKTANRVEFRDEATGQSVLWVLDYPRAFDSGDGQALGEIEVRRQGGASNLFITVRIPKTFFDSAVYPVFIDPTVDAQVAASADDAHETTGPAVFTNATNVWIRTSSIPWFGARVVITGPANGDTIDVAYATYTVGSNGARDDAYGDLMCEDEDNAGVFDAADIDDLSTRVKTSATVAWAQSNTGPNAGDPATSPSIVTPVQEVIDRAGWTSGNYLAWYFHATDTGGTCSFNVRTYDDGSSLAPQIHIEYTAASSDPQVNVNDAIGVAELASADVSDPQVSASDAIGVAENKELLITSFVDVNDAINVGENSELLITSFVEVNDAIGVAESTAAEVSGPQVNASDTIGVAESVSLAVVNPGDTTVSVTDNIGVAENVAVEVSAPQVNVNDAIGVAENNDLLVTSFVTVSEALALTDTPSLAVSAPQVNVSDGINVAESVGLSGLLAPPPAASGDGTIYFGQQAYQPDKVKEKRRRKLRREDEELLLLL